MFAKYGLTLACMSDMQINVCANCASVFTFFPHAYSACVSTYAVHVREGRCGLYLAQGAFHHSDVSQQDD